MEDDLRMRCVHAWIRGRYRFVRRTFDDEAEAWAAFLGEVAGFFDQRVAEVEPMLRAMRDHGDFERLDCGE